MVNEAGLPASELLFTKPDSISRGGQKCVSESESWNLASTRSARYDEASLKYFSDRIRGGGTSRRQWKDIKILDLGPGFRAPSD